MDGIRETYFAVMDQVRRAQADALAAFGLGPAECDYRVLASGPHWCLRSYAPAGGWASVLIVASSIKRPYIWDIDPDVSVIRVDHIVAGLERSIRQRYPDIRQLFLAPATTDQAGPS